MTCPLTVEDPEMVRGAKNEIIAVTSGDLFS